MPGVAVHEAEEYELPERHTEVENEGGWDFDEDNERDRDRLLGGHRRSTEGDGSSAKDLEGDGDHVPLLPREGEDEEMLGKGTKIEALIARTVPSTDDPSLPTITLRVLILGSLFCVIGASASQVFLFKSNSASFSTYFVILITYPLGHLMASEKLFRRGRRFLGIELNPGKFSIKEAILVSVIFSSGGFSAYAADIIVIMDLYFKTTLSALPSIVLLLTTQCIGFGLAGMLHNLLVSSPSMYWPSTLVTVQLFTTLYPSSAKTEASSRSLTAKRLQVFLVVFLITYIYQFLPEFLAPSLTSVSVLCLIDNQSWWLRTLGSGYHGAGLANFSFDWSSIGSSGPLFTPYWALGNWYGGLIGMCWVIAPIMLAVNFWNIRDFPHPMSGGLFNSAYQKFDVTSILNPDLSLNDEAWDSAKPLLLTPYFAMSYALSFAALTSILVHVYMWHRDEIREALSSREKQSDVHNTLMRSYLPVPSSWYIALLAINFIAAVLLVKTTPLQMPIWALILSIVIAVIFLVPCGVITAVSNTTIGLNVMTEFVAGLLMPGKPIGNVTFKCFGYMAMVQALGLTSDLKLGWYTSIPPREMFACQILGTVIGALTNYVTLIEVIATKRDFLVGTVVDPTGQWTARRPLIFYSASIVWGGVAPARFFAGKYVWLYGGFLLGAVVPVLLYLAHRRWPDKKLNKVVFPIICSGATMVPENPTNIILTGVMTAIFANSYIAKKYPKQHGQYVYVVSSALDAGTSITALSVYILFGGLVWTWHGPRWWGNPEIDAEHCVPGT